MAASTTLAQVSDLLLASNNGDQVAHGMLLEAVHRLQLEVEFPHETSMRVKFQPIQNIVVRIAIEYGLTQKLAASTKQPLTAAELGQQVGAEELIVERLMRMICWMGYCDEVGENTYKANATTEHVSTAGMIGGEKHHTDVIMPLCESIAPMIRAQGFHPYAENGFKDPFEWKHGCGLWEFFASNQEQKQAFDDYMAVRRVGTQLQWFDIYPAAARLDESRALHPDEVLTCDVGGGQGHETTKFRERHPDKTGRLIVQDLPQTLQGIELPHGIEAMPHDFFEPQPIKGARIYYMRNIMHDWPDSECRKILSHIVDAMDGDSTLLIDDYVMPATNADMRTIHMDCLMMMYVRAEERTERRWRSLLTSAGLEVVKIWTPPTAYESIIETKRRDLTSVR